MSRPLNVSASNSNASKATNNPSSLATKTPTKSSVESTDNTESTGVRTPLTRPEDATSPHELTAFVESMLTQLEVRFDEMSGQIIDRMTQMSSRVDALENAIHDLINGDLTLPATPGTQANGLPTARQSSVDNTG